MEGKQDFVVIYDIPSNVVSFSEEVRSTFSEELLSSLPVEDKLVEFLGKNIFPSSAELSDFRSNFNLVKESKEILEESQRYTMNTSEGKQLFDVTFVTAVPGKTVIVILKNISSEMDYINHLTHMTEYDELTGLMNLDTFRRRIRDTFLGKSLSETKGKFAILYFDVIRFKAVNDLFGKSGGDQLLVHIALVLNSITGAGEFACRIGSDRFALFIETENRDISLYTEDLISKISEFSLPVKISCNIGIYVIDNIELAPSNMLDRAILAQSTIKGIYTEQYAFYTEELRKQMLSEQEVVGSMAKALKNREFVPFFQPQYNHTNGCIVGAEALVRWQHPEKGMIGPGAFIPIFEANGFITPLDMYIFERVCEFQRNCLDSGIKTVPVSSNFSRYDIFQPDFVEKLEVLRKKYDVPVEYLRVEITESSFLGGSSLTNAVVHKLHDCGYIVEMDDFGSGYSSLNVLKDIDFDIIKLDMKFLDNESENGRGGTVISSVVNMAKWLDLPVIAEGVETVTQADFLKSIGAEVIQGYLYSKPLPEEKYVELLKESKSAEAQINETRNEEALNSSDFWNPKSIDTLVFNSFTGASCILKYCDHKKLELIRVNKKYLQELGLNYTEKDIFNLSVQDVTSSDEIEKYRLMLEKAIETGEEQECETWRTFQNSCCGEEKLCIRTTAKVIGKKNNEYILFASIRNITKEKLRFLELMDSERRFKHASEQANIYFWEYDIITKDMHPCFRCMRDLGLPPVVHNYPEPAIEQGIFPADYADMYRDWHKKLAEGVKELEAVIPLTVGRVPFTVRYTTEFDSTGRPVKAYGSATLVIDENK